MVSSSEGEHPGGCPRKMSPWKPRCGITFKGKPSRVIRNRAVAYQVKKQEQLIRSKVDSFIYACVLAASSGEGNQGRKASSSKSGQQQLGTASIYTGQQ
jgi:hypothetical protein